MATLHKQLKGTLEEMFELFNSTGSVRYYNCIETTKPIQKKLYTWEVIIRTDDIKSLSRIRKITSMSKKIKQNLNII